MGGSENGNFPLLHVVKMSLRMRVVQKSLDLQFQYQKTDSLMKPQVAWKFYCFLTLLIIEGCSILE